MIESKKPGIAIIGMGGNGTGAAKAVLAHPETVRLAAVCEPDPVKREKAAADFSVEAVSDHRDLLDRKDIDLVKVSTPNQFHARISIDFLLAGKHVYCEKPMAMSLKDCREMLEAEKRSGKHLVIGFELPFSVFYRRLDELLKAGTIGTLKSMQFQHSRGGWGHKLWALDRKISGGAIMECPIHEVDIFRTLGGEVEWVEVIAAPPSLPWYSPEVPDHFIAVFKFKSGAVGSMTVFHNRCATTFGNDVNPQNGTYMESGHEMKLSVMGDAGALEIDFWKTRINIYAYKPEDRHTELVRSEDYSETGHYRFHHDNTGYLIDFCRRIISGNKPMVSAVESFQSMVLTLAAEESISRNGERIVIADFIK